MKLNIINKIKSLKSIVSSFLIVFFLTGSVASIFAQTSVAGGSVNGTWTISGSPYLIQGSIMIENNQTLAIEPGVIVNFQGVYKMQVHGQLLAIGTVSDFITFTSPDTSIYWQGIRFDSTSANNDSSKIIYCKLQYVTVYGTGDDAYGGALFIRSFSKVRISNSIISNNFATFFGGGIYCAYSNPVITNNIISNNIAFYSDGGGIYCNASNPTIAYNVITNNVTSFGEGGGISCYSSNPIITNNIISNNAVSNGDGGGIFCYSSNPTIINNIISNNTTSFGGGGICCRVSNPTITYNTISNNTTVSGGGVFCYFSNPVIKNNTITNNTASFRGGGIACDSSILTLSNNTISNNKAGSFGGGIYCVFNSKPILHNSILWGNTVSIDGAQVYLGDQSSQPDIYYCNIQGGKDAFGLNGNPFTGTFQNNIDVNPLFVTPTDSAGADFDGLSANWSLLCASPCIDAGTPDTTGLNLPDTDFDGNARLAGCFIDIGAYEYQDSINQDQANADFTYNINGLQVTFYDSSIATSRLWNFGDGNSSTDKNPIHSYTIDSTYEVCLIVTNKCSRNTCSIDTFSTDTFCQVVTICQNPSANFIYLSNELEISFTDSSVNATSWSWNFGDGNNSFQQNPINTYLDTGSFKVCLTAINKCGTDTFCNTVIIKKSNSINPQSFFNYISVFPNPFRSYFIVKLSLKQPTSIILHISDIAGREIQCENETSLIPTIKNTWNFMIDLSGYNPGIYLLEIITDDEIHRVKLVMVR